jgi:accessory gene regulator protein AgrB
MSAIALSIVITDIYRSRIDLVTKHTILGGIISILFFTLCDYGYEYVNWCVLALMCVIIFVSVLFGMRIPLVNEADIQCSTCRKPQSICDCPTT